jgi:hypothetical protein
MIEEVNKEEELIGTDEIHDILEEVSSAYNDGFIQSINDISINHEYVYVDGITVGIRR